LVETRFGTGGSVDDARLGLDGSSSPSHQLHIEELVLLGPAVQLWADGVDHLDCLRHRSRIVCVELAEQTGEILCIVCDFVNAGGESVNEHVLHLVAGVRDTRTRGRFHRSTQTIVDDTIVQIVRTGSGRNKNALRTRGSDKVTVNITSLDEVREESRGVNLRCLMIKHHHGEEHVLSLVPRGIFGLVAESVFTTQRVVNVGKRLLYWHGDMPRIRTHEQANCLDDVNLAFMVVKRLGSRLGAGAMGTRAILGTVGVLGYLAVLCIALLEPARVRLLEGVLVTGVRIDRIAGMRDAGVLATSVADPMAVFLVEHVRLDPGQVQVQGNGWRNINQVDVVR
jgi:hypothetical protein